MSAVPLAGVIGHPIGHSRSPALHGHWLRQYGVDGHYVPLDIHPDDLAGCLQSLPRMGFRGANVTIPHKEAALRLADDVTDLARRIGAANTLSFHDGRLHADNTDAVGFIANLRDGCAGWDPRSGPAVVLGAGGAARAVVVGLLDAGAPEIRVLNRTRSRADALVALDPARVVSGDWAAVPAALSDAALLVNTTSLGMTGQPPLALDLSSLPRSAVVTDIVYTPLETALLGAARARGCAVVDGLGMLLHQAVPGFERWFGVRPQVTPALRAAVLA